jgi:glutamate transport system substrate-binding protein
MKHRTKLLILLLALLGAVALFAAACGGDDDATGKTPATTAPASPTKPAATPFPADSTMAAIVKRGKLIVGTKYDQPGFGLKDPVSGKVDGFDVAIGKEIAKSLGLKEDQVEFVEAVSKNRIPYLQEDKVDIVIATFTINAERKTQIEFSRPYYVAGQSILVKKDNTSIKAAADLPGKKVCTAQGSTPEQTLKAKYPTAELLLLDAYAGCVEAMKAGRVDAVSTDNVILLGFASTDATVKLVGGLFTSEPYGIGMKQGKKDMQAFVDSVLARMFADGTYDKIYDQYLGKFEGMPKAKEARESLPTTN